MGSVSSPGSGVSTLLDTLSSLSPELSTIFSSPNVQTALENASPADIVQLSDQAVELQNVSILFGSTDGSNSNGLSSSDSLFSSLSPSSSTTQADPLLQALEASLNVDTTSSLAAYGTTPTTNSSSQVGSILSTVA